MGFKKTYNKVVDAFQILADAHPQVKTFVNNHPLQINDLEVYFPVLALYPANSTIGRNELQLNFKFFIMDLLLGDYSNEDEIISDTLQIANDFIQKLYKDEDEFGFTINEDSIQMQPFAENYKANEGEDINDDVAGWYISFSVEVQNDFDECNLPFSAYPSPTPPTPISCVKEQISDYVWETRTSYIGTAPEGSSTSEDVWCITKIIINYIGYVTSTEEFEDVAWDDRYSL